MYCINIRSDDARSDDIFVRHYLSHDKELRMNLVGAMPHVGKSYMLCSHSVDILNKVKAKAGVIGSYFNRIKNEKIIEMAKSEMREISPLPWR